MAWIESRKKQNGGSGGHTILDNSGTALTQRTNLQFKGAYSEDNSGDDTTEVNVVRSMTKAQYDQLSAAEKVGIINVTDEKVTAADLPISSSDTTDTKTYIDNATTVTDVSSNIIRNTTNVSSTDYTINCYTVGKMAYLIITNLQTATAWSSDREIATGLPKPKTDFNFVGSLYNSNGGSSVRLRVKSNGDLYSWFNTIASGSNVFGCIAYPIA